MTASPPSDLIGALLTWAERTPDKLAFAVLPDDGPTEEETITYRQLLLRASSIGSLVRTICRPGAPVVLMLPTGLDFLSSFFGVLLGGGVPVPAFPVEPGRLQPTARRLSAIAADCSPAAVLTTAGMVAIREAVVQWAPELARARWTDVAYVEGVPLPLLERAAPDALAYLQYTSGSTASPRGVRVTHRSILANVDGMRRATGQPRDAVLAGWLPLFHDMGLVGFALNAMVSGRPCHLMSPGRFVRSPVRWLKQVTEHGVTLSGGPNFGYELCLSRVRDDDLARLDLSTWTTALNGSEPIRARTLEAFARRFAPCGFTRSAFFPGYGLAEATLIVTGGRWSVRRFDARALAEGRAEPATEGDMSALLVSAGAPIPGHGVAIVDQGGRPHPDGEVGEVWVRGPSVSSGYWNREADGDTFSARLDGSPDRHLRTGDLGFLSDGALFICGRIKDVIITKGRNVYPQDVEHTVERAHPAVRTACAVVWAAEEAAGETVAIVAEVRPASIPEADAVVEAIRLEVARFHDVPIGRVVLVRPHTIPLTTSGKLRRQACREALAGGNLAPVAEWGLPA